MTVHLKAAPTKQPLRKSRLYYFGHTNGNLDDVLGHNGT